MKLKLEYHQIKEMGNIELPRIVEFEGSYQDWLKFIKKHKVFEKFEKC